MNCVCSDWEGAWWEWREPWSVQSHWADEWRLGGRRRIQHGTFTYLTLPCCHGDPSVSSQKWYFSTSIDSPLSYLSQIFSAKKTHQWVLNKAGVKREVLATVKARKLAYYGHTMRKQESCLEKEIMQGTMPVARRRGRSRTAWMDNIKTWTGLSVEESIRMTEDRDKWRKYVHGVANPRIEDN